MPQVEHATALDFRLAAIDFVIVAIYIIVILGIGFWVGRKKEDTESYFLAGRGTRWPLIGFALMAANLSGTSYIGLAGAGYSNGISVWNYEWMATLVLVFFAFFIMPFYIQSRISTMPEFLERRYDRRSRYVFSGFTLFTAMFVDSAGALFAGAITLQLLFPHIPLWLLIAVVALLGGLYVILGGLRAVMITDTIQGVLMLLAGSLIFFFCLRALGSWEAVRQAAPEGGFSVIQPADDSFMPWPGIFTGVVWLGFYYWTTNHVVVQKVLSARSLDHGRWGALFAGLTQLPLLFILVLPGVMGRALYPNLDGPDQIWPALAFDFMPTGLRGLVFAALVAALMSTLDSVLNGASALVVNDFIKTRKRAMPDQQLLFLGRVMVGVFMVVAAVWAPQIANFPTIVEYFQSLLGHITMPVVVVFLGGVFWRRATPHAAFTTLVVGIPIGLMLFFGGPVLGGFNIQFLYATGLMFAGSLAVFIVASLVTIEPEPEKIEGYTWSWQTWQTDTAELRGKPLWQNYRVLALALTAVTIVMIMFFV